MTGSEGVAFVLFIDPSKMKVKDMFFCFSSFFPFLRASDGHLNISFILLYHHKQVLVVFFFFLPPLSVCMTIPWQQ